MKRYFPITLILLLVIILLMACGSSDDVDAFELVDDEVDIQLEVTHKDGKISKLNQVSTIVYEDVGIDKDTAKEMMDQEAAAMEDIDAIKIDTKYDDDKLVQTIDFNIAETDLDQLSEILDVDADESDLDYESYKNGILEQGFVEK